jgi:hypothetical protein
MGWESLLPQPKQVGVNSLADYFKPPSVQDMMEVAAFGDAQQTRRIQGRIASMQLEDALSSRGYKTGTAGLTRNIDKAQPVTMTGMGPVNTAGYNALAGKFPVQAAEDTQGVNAQAVKENQQRAQALWTGAVDMMKSEDPDTAERGYKLLKQVSAGGKLSLPDSLPDTPAYNQFAASLQAVMTDQALQPAQKLQKINVLALDAKGKRQTAAAQMALSGAEHVVSAEKGTYQDVGTTPDGRTVSYNPRDGKRYVEGQGGALAPYAGKVMPKVEKIIREQGAGAAGPMPAIPAGTPGQKNEAALSGLPDETKNLVKGIAEYRIQLPGGFALRTPYWQGILNRVASYDPTFEQAQYTVRYRLRQDFTSGKSAQNVRSLNTAVGHLDTLDKKGKALDNAPVQVWNWIANRGLTATGDKRVTEFNMAANAVESELAATFKGMGATDQEIKAWRENLNAAQSPAQLKGAIDTAVELMSSRLGALQSQYETGLGRPKDFHFLTEKSRSILKKLGADVDKLDGTGQTAAQADKTGGKGPMKVGRFTVEVE